MVCMLNSNKLIVVDAELCFIFLYRLGTYFSNTRDTFLCVRMFSIMPYIFFIAESWCTNTKKVNKGSRSDEEFMTAVIDDVLLSCLLENLIMERNPNLSLRNPENTSAARSLALIGTAVRNFSSNISNVLQQHGFTADTICNFDDSVSTRREFLTPKSQKTNEANPFIRKK